ncbi:hypothetical protein LEN26_007046 [Aphanomyces euteiches]|nr:hypothetical protein AeMF1_014293 [Aphanomyces euteiches]KAH9133712.1 hypothetical protein LEN26_007046 [Aphanomyces euteiches]KAH9188921.1 hypothetical protein AeNC1_009105 [Aphanomyces euteiches]
MVFDEFFAKLTAIRRTIHENPELSFREVKTQALVRDYLINQAQIPQEQIHSCGKTGLVVDIFGPTEGPKSADGVLQCVAFRGDMDALSMTERNPHLPYVSKIPGAAHMCGHDGHTANLMGFAFLVQQRRHLLPPHSKVRVVFQPAEENNYGAVAMIKGGCLDGVDEIYGYHNYAYPLGNIHVKAGPIMAQCIDFRIKISGSNRSGWTRHCGHANHYESSLSPHDAAVVSICQVHGGEADNVIPSSVVLSGTVRDFLPAVSQNIHARMKSIVENICASYGVEGVLEFHDFFPAVVNHTNATKIVQEVAANVVGVAKVSEEGLPRCGAEDFAYYLEQRPGCFFSIGTKHKDDTQNRNCHSDTFDFNDAITPLAIRMFLEIVNKRLKCTLYSPEERIQMTKELLEEAKK